MRKFRTCNEADDETDDDDSGGSDGRVPQVGDCVEQVDARSDTTRHTHTDTHGIGYKRNNDIIIIITIRGNLLQKIKYDL